MCNIFKINMSLKINFSCLIYMTYMGKDSESYTNTYSHMEIMEIREREKKYQHIISEVVNKL